jgi:penicillin-binding protein 1A
MIDNGGKRISPSLIERIDDRHGQTIYRRDTRTCNGCMVDSADSLPKDAVPPVLEDDRDQVIDPRVAYQMVSMLQGVTIRGTAARAHLELKNIVAGKTGTTNDSNDTWFIGFSPDLVAGVFVGYDTPRTMGKKETGASVALPAFISFMKEALKNTPNTPFRVPRGIQLVQVDLHTGVPVSAAAPQGTVIDEAYLTGGPIFIPGITSMPSDTETSTDVKAPVKEGEIPAPAAESPPPPPVDPEKTTPPVSGTGGLY